MTFSSIVHRLATTTFAIVAVLLQGSAAQAVALNIADGPLFLNTAVTPMNMLVMGRDHKLYYEAYNDRSDLNGDGVLDIGYKPGVIDYYGYFDSYKCYTYSTSGNGSFAPSVVTANKQCTGMWSGDFLNYLTMTRMDALRKVLYGGFRLTDGTTTVLERSHVPQDAHSWGKEYNGLADGYDITKYTPLAMPTTGTRHLFANTTVLNDANQLPRLRILQNQTVRIWNWVSIERPVANTQVVTGITSGGGEIRSDVTPTNRTVRVSVCVAGLLESNCRLYPNGNYKPTGLLHDFGENDSMYFGLLTGSYSKNTSGGVLRRAIGSVKNEIDSNSGVFLSYDGIITTLNRFRTTGFGGNYQYSCGSTAAGRPIVDGDCQMWGNPVGEMMFETMRYFAGKGAATAAYNIAFGAGEESQLAGGGLPVATWDDPYTTRPSCSKPFQTVISDVNNSYDTDQLPGTAFGSFSSDINLNVNTLGQTIWDNEIGASGTYFIGQSGAVSDGAPTAKTVTSFGNIRGLSPEEPTKLGGYYPASVAHFGYTNDLHSAAGSQKLSTFAVALASPLPKIEIPIAGKTVTLVPFAKTVGGAFGITATQGAFQPTNQIVDFYVDELTDTTGRFRVNFEDVEQGNDHDMDAIVVYDYVVSGSSVKITLNSEYAAGGAYHHLGFVISGTTEDGIYLPVRDRDTAASNDPNYFLDTPNVSGALPLTWEKTFTPGSSPGASILKDPLWYAAKWGGFKDSDNNNLPNVASEWDANNDGLPDNYFLVTNALNLKAQLTSAFDEIIARVASASSASVNAGSISSTTRVYQAKFNSGDWTGQLLSFPVRNDGSLSAQEWDAAQAMPAHNSRTIITVGSAGATSGTSTVYKFGMPFRLANFLLPSPLLPDSTRIAQLEPLGDGLALDRVNFLRGDGSREKQNGGPFRQRPTKLGDIVSSAPVFVGEPPFFYSDSLESAPYSAFKTLRKNREQIVYAGANDGMLHGFNAQTGTERFAFIPGAVFGNLAELSKPSYTHRYFVDGTPTMGDVFYSGSWHTVLVGGLNKGGQSVYALDITNPANFTEANAASIFRWEFTDQDLGYTYSRPAIVRMKNGKWAAIFGNGYNNTLADGSASTTGRAYLYVVDIETGARLAKIDTGVGSVATPNGLGTPAVVDINGDSIVDYAYAGDLQGNLWKFNLTSTTASNWNVAYFSGSTPQPLFTAKDASDVAQPITTRPEVGRGPRGAGMVVLVGTGKFLENADKSPTQTQSFYGILDPNTLNAATDRVTARSQLTQQQITVEQTVDFGGVLVPIRVTTDNAIGNNRGWYLDLLSGSPGVPPPSGFKGEMQVSDSILRNGRIIFTTVIPSSDPCAFGGDSWLMEIDALTGARLKVTPFDLNNDNEFDEDDFTTILVNGQPVKVPVSGRKSDVGITPKPGILTGEKAEYKYTPGTSGNIQVTVENPGANASGRQSWRQIR